MGDIVNNVVMLISDVLQLEQGYDRRNEIMLSYTLHNSVSQCSHNLKMASGLIVVTHVSSKDQFIVKYKVRSPGLQSRNMIGDAIFVARRNQRSQ